MLGENLPLLAQLYVKPRPALSQIIDEGSLLFGAGGGPRSSRSFPAWAPSADVLPPYRREAATPDSSASAGARRAGRARGASVRGATGHAARTGRPDARAAS